MSTSFTDAQIERLKREAKVLQRTLGILHAQALDHTAARNGYDNWSLLMKHRTRLVEALGISAQPAFLFIRTREQMRVATHKVAGGHVGAGRADDIAKQQVDDIAGKFVSPLNAIEFAIAFVECLLTVPRFKIYSSAPVYWEMRRWLPYCVLEPRDGDGDGARILVNRHYKPVGSVSSEWVRYEDFAHLQANLSHDQRKRFTCPGAEDGYLFHDLCPPWDCRAAAMSYLKRLHTLRDLLRA